MTTRDWLQENGYADIVQLIDQVMEMWKASGARTRRNWWEVLAGGVNGASRTVEGVTFPVLATAQRHEGRSITPNAIKRDRSETPPEKSYHGRALRRRPRRASKS